MTQHPMHPGRPMQLMVSTSAQPPTTTSASNSTSHPRNASVSLTRGAYIQPIAKSLLLCNMISPLPLQQTFSSHLGALYLQQPLQKLSISERSKNDSYHGRTMSTSNATSSEGG
jgi:hypothetical protein